MKRHKKENLSLSLDAETRLLAEHAAAVQGCDSLSEFVEQLIQEHVPQILEQYTTITLTESQYELFLELCKTPQPASAKLIEAAKLLDQQGF
ncbi:MAG: DUF1778 domain-containing protein [Acinetobacter sp.]